MPLDPELLKILACPACKQPLEYIQGDVEALDCPKCDKRYPVKDGIPVLLAEEAATIPRR